MRLACSWAESLKSCEWPGKNSDHGSEPLRVPIEHNFIADDAGAGDCDLLKGLSARGGVKRFLLLNIPIIGRYSVNPMRFAS